jgi:hypothetical protein
MANTWNEAGTTWDTGLWGTTDPITSGWGAKSWNDGAWGNLQDETVVLTGISLTSNVGSLVTFPEQGWGRDTWGFEDWGDSSQTVPITGLSITSNVGSLEAYNEVGWGRDGWGEEAWGAANDFALILNGQQATGSTGVLNPADVMGVTGVSSTSETGSLDIVIDFAGTITGQEATTSVGSLSPADVVGITGQSATTSTGILNPADVIGISGVSTTVSEGYIGVSTNPIVDLVGIQSTSSTGILNPADVFGINGQETTSGNIWSTNDGAALSTAQKQFGTASLLLSDDSTRDYVQTVGNIDLSGSQNFTAECWLRPNSQSGTQRIFKTGLDAGSDNEQLYLLGNTFYATVGPSTILFTHTHTLATDAFTAIAYTRNGNTRRLFINGVAVASGTNANKPSSGPFGIGYSTVDNQAFDGYIDEFRLSDTDRYGASSYTPVTSEFTVDANTLSLLHFDGVNGSTTITDSVPPVFAFQASTGQGSVTSISNVAVVPNGQSMTASVAIFGTSNGFGIQAFEPVDTGSNSSYTDVATGSNTIYTDAA